MDRDENSNSPLNLSAQETEILDSLPVLVAFIGPDQRYLYNNKAYELRHRLTTAEIRGKHIREVLGEEVYQKVSGDIEKVLSGQTVVFEDYLSPQRVGNSYVKVTMVPHSTGSSVNGFTVLVQDLTEQKQNEERLRASEEEFRSIFELSTAGKVEADFETGRFLRMNIKFCKMTGYDEKELSGATFESITPPEDYLQISRLMNITNNGSEREWMMEHRIVRKDGSSFWVCTNGAFIYKEGRPYRTIAVIHNINDLKESERKLKDAYGEIKDLKDRIEAENIYLKKMLDEGNDYGRIIGQSSVMKYVLFRVEKVARSSTTVLLLGETGTGKGLIARAIHDLSERRSMPFVTVNCAALPANLIESELFGREKGAYTGATNHQIGRFEIAAGGTLFLDEIGEMPLELQSKLLRVLETGEFEKLGSSKTTRVDVRLIASTNRDLEEEIAAGRFRKDLFYRLNVFPVTLPTLSQRSEDIMEISNFFLQKFNTKYGKEISNIPPEAAEKMISYSWPGNVRELQNVIERAVILSSEGILYAGDELFPAGKKTTAKSPAPAITGSPDLLDDVQRQHILRTLSQTKWKIEGSNGAATQLGIKPSTLRARMKKLGISRPS